MNWIKKLFTRDIQPIPKIVTKVNTLVNIDDFDDVWIKIDQNTYQGWIMEKKEDRITVVYSDENNLLQDTEFLIERPLNRTCISQGNKTLILNKNDLYN